MANPVRHVRTLCEHMFAHVGQENSREKADVALAFDRFRRAAAMPALALLKKKQETAHDLIRLLVALGRVEVFDNEHSVLPKEAVARMVLSGAARRVERLAVHLQYTPTTPCDRRESRAPWTSDRRAGGRRDPCSLGRT
jgi:hypothetical protein